MRLSAATGPLLQAPEPVHVLRASEARGRAPLPSAPPACAIAPQSVAVGRPGERVRERVAAEPKKVGRPVRRVARGRKPPPG